MIKLYSPTRVRHLIELHDKEFQEAEARFGVPADWLRAIVCREMEMIDLMDLAADCAVYFYHLRRQVHRFLFHRELVVSDSRFSGKKDSSTGWAQIFGSVAIGALNFASDKGITNYAAFGFNPADRLDPANPDDIFTVWRRLNRDRSFNIEMAALNLLSCSEEMNGSIQCQSFSPEEIKRCFTRYNANSRDITPYGEAAYLTLTEFQRLHL